jgi:hypothetical protein
MSLDDLAPGLLQAEAPPGLLGRLSKSMLERKIERRVEVDRILEWRRLAPGGSPLWILPDSDLEAMINELAPSSRARTVELTYFLDEFDRRQRRRLNEQLADANRKMVLLTRAVLAFTGVLVILAILSTVAVVA